MFNEYGYQLEDGLNRISLWADALTDSQLDDISPEGCYTQRAALEVAAAIGGVAVDGLVAARLRELVADGTICYFEEAYFAVGTQEYDENSRHFGRWRQQLAELRDNTFAPALGRNWCSYNRRRM